LEKW
jgi:hypothetical protein